MRKRDELTDPDSCMGRARDDEMTFVLLGRDVAAPATIRAWVAERIRLGKNAPGDAQTVEAEECARTMEAERASPAAAPDTPPELARLRELEAVVRRVLAQEDDDHCWRDAYTEMAGLVGVEWRPRVLDRRTMLRNCEHFVDCLLSGEHYVTPTVPRARYQALRDEFARHSAAAVALYDGIYAAVEAAGVDVPAGVGPLGAVEALAAARRWVPAGYWLVPNECQAVAITVRHAAGSYVSAGFYRREGEDPGRPGPHWDMLGGGWIGPPDEMRVTHWMPLPGLPAEGGP